jgi:hypothetical protein
VSGVFFGVLSVSVDSHADRFRSVPGAEPGRGTHTCPGRLAWYIVGINDGKQNTHSLAKEDGAVRSVDYRPRLHFSSRDRPLGGRRRDAMISRCIKKNMVKKVFRDSDRNGQQSQ